MPLKRKFELGQRLRQLRGKRTQISFGGLLGLKQPHYSAYERGEMSPGAELLVKIVELTHCNPHWLLTGLGEPYPSMHVKEGEADYVKPFRLPVVSAAHANPVAVAKYAFPTKKYIEIHPKTICIEVTDDSMMPITWPGQCVLCDPEAEAKSGDMVVVKLKGQAQLFKRAYYVEKAKEWLFNSVNPARAKPPLIVPAKRIEFIYRVVGTIYEPCSM